LGERKGNGITQRSLRNAVGEKKGKRHEEVAEERSFGGEEGKASRRGR
jgi:hypothetical protein